MVYPKDNDATAEEPKGLGRREYVRHLFLYRKNLFFWGVISFGSSLAASSWGLLSEGGIYPALLNIGVSLIVACVVGLYMSLMTKSITGVLESKLDRIYNRLDKLDTISSKMNKLGELDTISKKMNKLDTISSKLDTLPEDIAKALKESQ